MLTPSDYRQAYGEIFISELPDGTVVPWVPLSLKDHFSYTEAIRIGNVALAVLEDEIFLKCVKDPVLVKNIEKQKAGTVSSIADIILKGSAPQSVEEFEFLLDISRDSVNNILHQSVCVITQAFPGYTPDDVYAMDIYTMMERVALAERKLLENGVIKEPIAIPTDNPKQKVPRKPKVNLTKLKQEYEKQQAPNKSENWNARERQKENLPLNQSYVEEESFVDLTKLENEDEDTVVSLKEIVYNLDADVTAGTSLEKQMIDEAKFLYKDYIEKMRNMKKGEKIKIKPVDDRIEEAKERVERNKKKLMEKIKKSKK